MSTFGPSSIFWRELLDPSLCPPSPMQSYDEETQSTVTYSMHAHQATTGVPFYSLTRSMDTRAYCNPHPIVSIRFMVCDVQAPYAYDATIVSKKHGNDGWSLS